jgi:hypothetical protein
MLFKFYANFLSAMHISSALTGGGVKDMDARGARNDYFHHISIERFKVGIK